MNRLLILDGWRGLSILLVLIGHLFPIGRKDWLLNQTVSSTGMVIFFILSGFLVTNILIHNQSLIHFLIKRFFRIVPLAWLYMLIALPVSNITEDTALPNLLFYANWPSEIKASYIWPPLPLLNSTAHLWSLCVEVQFYLLIAFLMLIMNKRTFLILL